MAEEKAETKVKKEELKTLVVAQLPTQSVNKARDESGKEFNLITIEEALSEILDSVRVIRKSIA